MYNLVKYNFQENNIRVIIINNEPWFVARDVCDVLEITNSRSAIKNLDSDDKQMTDIETPAGKRKVSIISESGLYDLTFSSRKPEAKEFKKWVTKTVLPEIRKTGSFNNPNLIQIDPSKNQPELLEYALKLSKKIEEQEPYVEIAKDFLTVNSDLKSINEVAKELGTGEIKLLKILRDEKFLYYADQQKKKKITPYQIHIDAGRATVINSIEFNDSGKKTNRHKVYISPKGQAYISLLLKKRNGKIPGSFADMVERLESN